MSKLDRIYQIVADRIGFGIADAVVRALQMGCLLGEALSVHGLTIGSLAR